MILQFLVSMALGAVCTQFAIITWQNRRSSRRAVWQIAALYGGLIVALCLLVAASK